MTVDFRALQTQLNKIITSGSTGRNALLLIYPYSASDGLNQGGINATKFPATGIGTDVFMFVSGAVGGKDTIANSVAVFGGDVHISGSLTSDQTIFGSGGGSDPSASYVVIGATASLANERVLAAGFGVYINDNGAGNNVVITAKSGSFADVSASYVVVGTTSSLPNERVLTAGPNITINDYGSVIAITGSAASSGSSGNGADISASYIVVGATSSLPNERVLTAGPNVTINDYGSIIAISGSTSFPDVTNDTRVTSSNGTAKTVFTYTTDFNDQVIDLHITAFGRQYSGVSGTIGECAKFILEAVYERTGSLVRGIDTNVISFYPSSSLNAQFNVSGSDIQVQVVGENGRNMDWRCITEINVLTSSIAQQADGILSGSLKLWYEPNSFNSASFTWFNKADDGGLNIDVVGQTNSSSLVNDTNGQAVKIEPMSSLTDSFSGTYIPSGSKISVWHVGRASALNVFSYIWIFGGATNTNYYQGSNNIQYQWQPGQRQSYVPTATDVLSQSFVTLSTYSIGDGFYKGYFNGNLVTSGTNNGLSAAATSFSFGLNTSNMTHYVNEFICAVDATENQITAINNYLNNKWSIY